jgi:hypothetical protein
MPPIFDPNHSAFDLSPTQIQSYLRWSERLAWALALLIPFTALLVGNRPGMVLAVGMTAILVFLAREVGGGKSEAAIGLLFFALARLLGGLLGLLVVPVLFALVEIVVFAQGARAAMALKRGPLRSRAGDAVPLAAAHAPARLPAWPPEKGWTKHVWFDLTVGLVLIVSSITSFMWLFTGLQSSGSWGGIGLLLIPVVQLAAILLGCALLVAAWGGMRGRTWVPTLRWITYLVMLGGMAAFGGDCVGDNRYPAARYLSLMV